MLPHVAPGDAPDLGQDDDESVEDALAEIVESLGRLSGLYRCVHLQVCVQVKKFDHKTVKFTGSQLDSVERSRLKQLFNPAAN